MHELPVMQQVLRVVLDHAQTHQVQQVLGVQMRVGQLGDLEEEWMQRYFDHLARDTVAQGAKLKIERVAAGMQCRVCALTFQPDLEKDERIMCPECGATDCVLVSGQEYTVVALEAV